MLDICDSAGHLLPDDQWLNRFGRFLRSTSLDKLPELFKILSRLMSPVGPRPLLMKYLPLYSPQQSRRHEVRPGPTGWAQVNGRNALSWEDIFAHDVWYVDHLSFLLGLKILLLALLSVVRREGNGQEGHVTMTEVMGSQFTGSQQ